MIIDILYDEKGDITIFSKMLKGIGSIRLKLFIIVLVTFIITGSVFTLIILSDIKKETYQEKKIQSKQIVDSSLGVLKYFYQLEQAGNLSEKKAKQRAKSAIKNSTYGANNKNYLWITDFHPRMIMHPFKSELIGQDLSNVKDPNGVYLFNEAVKTVKENGAGYVEYQWQYYGNETRIEPKISYVTAFKPWNWILGTGIYINDIESKINKMRNRIILIALVIMLLVCVIIYCSAELFLAPIIAAAKFANEIARGNLDIKPLEPIDDNDEIGDLLSSLNEMKDKLKKQINKLSQKNEELKREKDKLQKYLDVAEVVFLIIDPEGKVSLINKKGCKILGYSEEEILGKNWVDNFVKEAEKDKVKRNFNKMINEKELIENFENKVIAKNGDELTFVWHNTILRDETGNVQGILSSGMDLTKQRLLQEKLEHSKLKTEFFANVSHELKTPLNLIFSALQMLNLFKEEDLSAADEEKFEKYINIIKQNSHRLLRLVNNLVDITKIQTDSFNLNLQNHNIVKVVEEITQSVEDYIKHKDRILQFNSEIQEKVIACDPFNIERIMLNLLSNAVKFTDEGDKISVNISEEGEKVLISVSDTGIGIKEDKQEVIFERFGQADKSLTRNSEGSGIGLSIVKLLVEMHGGNITVESKYGEGSKFIIELPAVTVEEYGYSRNVCGGEAHDLTDRVDIEFSDIYDL